MSDESITNPYQFVGAESFWKTCVAEKISAFPDVRFLPKFDIQKETKIATYGSCFAQNVRVAIEQAGGNYLDCEPVPLNCNSSDAQKFGYNMFSSRTGNVYTAHQFLQLTEECFGRVQPNFVFTLKNQKFLDAIRPTIEPKGYKTLDELEEHRKFHLSRVKQTLLEADVLILTLGLIEQWKGNCGTIFAGQPQVYQANSQAELFISSYPSIKKALIKASEVINLQRGSPLPILLTVSPVPLTATATGGSVFVANAQSKSSLRAVAGDLKDENPLFDYFPSFELLTNCWTIQHHFEPNQLNVTHQSVNAVMHAFFAANNWEITKHVSHPGTFSNESTVTNRICEDQLLDAFNSKSQKAN